VTERKAIEERLRKKQAEILALEEKTKSAKVYVQALNDILKLIDNTDGDNESVDTKLRPGSAVAQARDIILERGSPVHLDELLEAMGKEVTRDSKASLAGSIAAYVRRDEIFTRPAPNTFGLAELGREASQYNPEELNGPPSGFGNYPITSDFDDDVPF
jgi:hypothetical protein